MKSGLFGVLYSFLASITLIPATLVIFENRRRGKSLNAHSINHINATLVYQKTIYT